MVQLTLPRGSKPTKGRHHPAPEGAKTVKTFLLYPPKVRSGVKGAQMDSVAGLALTHSLAKAVVAGPAMMDPQ